MTRPRHQHSPAFKVPFIVALIAALVASPARATNFSWANPVDGAYLNPGAWTPFDIPGGVVGPPGPGDTANFNLGQTPATRYTVFGVTGQSDRLLIGNDALELNIPSGETYELLNNSSTNNGIVVGQTSGQTGDLLITGGGTLKGVNGVLGDAAGSTGTVNVTGAGSTWTNDFVLDIGSNGSGTLNIQDGGSVITNFSIIGRNPNSKGTATVTGAGSTWDVNAQLFVGTSGDGTLNVQDGGTVSSRLSQIAAAFGSTSAVTVNGAGSTWNISSELAIGVGVLGNGTLNIQAGGVVSNLAGSIAGQSSSSTGTVTVTGAGSRWMNNGNLNVGGNFGLLAGGNGMLNILDSGIVEVTGLTKISGSGTVTLNGGTFSTRSLQVLGTFNFDQGTLNLTNSNLSIGPGAGIPGFFDSTLSLQPGMAVNVTGGTSDVAAGGQLLVNGSTASFSAVGGTNDGQISVIGGTLAYTDAMTNNTKISAIDATLSFAGDGIPTSSGGNNADGLTNLGTLNLLDTTVNGDVHSPTGSTINVAGNVTFNGLVSGGANFTGAGTTTTFNGGHSPGDSPAVVSVDGSLVYGSANTLTIELGGLLAGEFDQLQIMGDATLDGLLDVQLLSGFGLESNQQFTILDVAGTRAGEFAGLGEGAMVGNFGGQDLFISYAAGDGNDVALFTAVPEPSSLMLLAMGLLGLCRTRNVGRNKR